MGKREKREVKARFERRVFGQKLLTEKPPRKNTLSQKPPCVAGVLKARFDGHVFCMKLHTKKLTW
jgi:hypothetical protein